MGPIQLVVFDMAGTTIDDRGNVVLTALVDTARQYDLPGTTDELNALMGMNKIEVFRLLYKQQRPQASDATIEPLAQQALNTFVEHMRSAYQNHLAPIAGAEETFAFLRARDIKIAVDTGFDATIGGLVMQQLQWPDHLIDTVVYSSDVTRGRPAPYLIFHAMERLGVLDVHQVMKLGDSPADLEEGYNAGCGEVIGVLSGAHNAETLGKYYHTRLIDSVADVPALFN